MMFAATKTSMETFERAVSDECTFQKRPWTEKMLQVDPQLLESKESSLECISWDQELLV